MMTNLLSFVALALFSALSCIVGESAHEILVDERSVGTPPRKRSLQVPVSPVDAELQERYDQDKLVYAYDDCPVECAIDEFCGKDLTCHRHDCEQIYAFGRPLATGYDPASSDDLVCLTMNPGEEDRTLLDGEDVRCDGAFPSALSLNCAIGSTCPRPGDPRFGFSVPMNRKCAAKTAPDRFFYCYDLAPGTDAVAYFEDYIASTMDLVNTTCETNATDNTTELWLHHYGNSHVNQIDNWIVYSGDEGRPSSAALSLPLAASNVAVGNMYLDEDEIFPYCKDQGCKASEFCGRDLRCHEINCETLYKYGPSNVTGHGSDTPPALTCTNVLPQEEEICATWGGSWPSVVSYDCVPADPNRSIGGHDSCGERNDFNRTQGRFETFNRFCSASPASDKDFTCFDMDPDMDFAEYFQGYIDEVEANPDCDGVQSDTYVSAEWVGRHRMTDSCAIYDVTEGTSSVDCMLRFSSNGAIEFDPEQARFIIRSRLDVDYATDSPTESPGGASGSRLSLSSAALWWLVAFSSHIAGLLVFFP